MTTHPASNPNTPGDLLTQYATHPGLAPQVASNPNTPIKTLLHLAPHYPLEVARNPALPLAITSGVITPKTPHVDAFASLVTTRVLPGHLLEFAVTLENDEVNEALLANPNTPAVVLERLQADGYKEAQHHVNAPPSVTGERGVWLRSIVTEFPYPYEPLLQALQPLVPAADAAALAVSVDHSARHYAATLHNLPANHLETLSQDDFDTIRYQALKHPNLPKHCMSKALRGMRGDVTAVAENPNLPREELHQLLNDDDEIVVAAALKNPQVTLEELLVVVEEKKTRSIFELVAVAESPRLPPSALERLAGRDMRPAVRIAVAGNPAANGYVRGLLQDDPEERVRAALASGPRLDGQPEVLLHDPASIISAGFSVPQGGVVLAGSLHLLPLDEFGRLQVGRWLAGSTSWQTRWTLASNETVPGLVLELLRDGDADRRVRAAAAQTLEAQSNRD